VTPSVALIRGVMGSIDVVGHFPQLAQLNLSKNKITELPSSIEMLTSLVELNVADNRVQRVALNIAQLVQLSVLDLSGNAFEVSFCFFFFFFFFFSPSLDVIPIFQT
jgi:hypothetical protein